MGLNISIETLDGKEHPDWDWIRHAGDREFAALAGTLPQKTKGGEQPWLDDVIHIRPADFAAWRAALVEREWPNSGRFEKALDLLEANEDYWLYFGW